MDKASDFGSGDWALSRPVVVWVFWGVFAVFFSFFVFFCLFCVFVLREGDSHQLFARLEALFFENPPLHL